MTLIDKTCEATGLGGKATCETAEILGVKADTNDDGITKTVLVNVELTRKVYDTTRLTAVEFEEGKAHIGKAAKSADPGVPANPPGKCDGSAYAS